MSLVNILNVEIDRTPVPYLSGFNIEITFECLQELREGKLALFFSDFCLDLEFNLIFVGSSTDPGMDQEIDSLLVGPVPVGINKFVLQSEVPNPALMNPTDVMDYTAVFLKCQYRNREFLRCSYLVKAEYDNEQMQLNLPPQIVFDRLIRFISNDPKVTRFPIPWDGEEEMPPPQPDADSQPAIDLNAPLADDDEDEEEDDEDDDMDMEEMGGAK
ncbi:Histone chaperone asf1 [Entomophthora muscae]|uniref:Histone chaperone asf1 n=2 Tax=Entomophthora muscae TaxID=34485 RepID=A0ACC2S3U3_9FUNG|nr:Histone chaperone asf1 [Entomophthora muscae]KAJ9056966.1 Histone chaperone asf1 [Entomophthora muscae]